MPEESRASSQSGSRSGSFGDEEFEIGEGRSLPSLLFVTSTDALSEIIGLSQTSVILSSLRKSGFRVFDALAKGLTAHAAAEQVRSKGYMQGIKGVVLLGGFAVVPSNRLDVLDAQLKKVIDLTELNDGDDFVVWNDDVYGDVDGDRIAELPVSRIPDAESADFLETVLRASNKRTSGNWAGLRNVARPFADDAWKILSNGSKLLTSEPVSTEHLRMADNLAADANYLMLHGAASDATRFWGERLNHGNGDRYVEAFDVDTVPGGTLLAFAGCCWGGLSSNQPAKTTTGSSGLESRTPENSIALKYLASGARAFVGCTGSHYSPEGNGNYFGAPMHRAFFLEWSTGKPPALALFNAKRTYALGIPHEFSDPVSIAIEKKILLQFTCLGLGW